MGLFTKKPGVAELALRRTDLDEKWFRTWAEGLRLAVGDERFITQLNADSIATAYESLLTRACYVIDNDCRDYVSRYCDQRSLRDYIYYFNSVARSPGV